jgi:excisionase family DNA binding protein
MTNKNEAEVGFDVKGAANFLGCSVAKVRKDIRNRKYAFYRVGSLIRIRKEVLEAQIAQHTVEAVDAKAIAKKFLKH